MGAASYGLLHFFMLERISPERRCWVIFTLGAFAFFMSFFHRVAPGALAGELTQAFAVSGATLGALAATYFYVYMVMQIPTGVLVDTLGPRKVLAAGGLVAGLGSVAFGLADGIAAAAVGRTAVGLGVSVAFVALLKLNATWFAEHRFATVSGYSNLIGIAGALAATAPLAWIIQHVSWRSVFVAAGVASLALAAASWLLVRDRPERPLTHGTHAPADHWWDGLLEVARNRATWPAFWVTFGISGSFMSFIGLWAAPFLKQVYGMSAIAASQHTSLLILASAISLAAIGTWSDRLGRRRPLIIASGLSYLACWLAWIVGVPAGWTYVVALLTGFAVTGFSLAWPCAKEVNRPASSGMAISLANTGGFLAAGILQPLVGAVLDHVAGGAAHAVTLEQFRPALFTLAAFACVGLCGACFIRETHCRNIWTDTAAGSKT